jgi:hypothetical protein
MAKPANGLPTPEGHAWFRTGTTAMNMIGKFTAALAFVAVVGTSACAAPQPRTHGPVSGAGAVQYQHIPAMAQRSDVIDVKTQLDAGYWLTYGQYLAATSQHSDQYEDPATDANYWTTYGRYLAARS